MTVFAADQLEPGVYSLKEAGQRLGIAESTAYDLVKRGQFPVPVIQIGGRNRVLKAVLERFLAGDTPASASSPDLRGPAAADGSGEHGAAVPRDTGSALGEVSVANVGTSASGRTAAPTTNKGGRRQPASLKTTPA